jgi:ribose transport system ATP-binding protein
VRQKLEIARALAREPSILLLDEPTSSLSSRDVGWLARRLDELRDRGTTVIFITHRMREVRRFCERLTVLRNGRHVQSVHVADISDEDVVRMVIGRSLAATFPPRRTSHRVAGDEPTLSVRGIRAKGKIHDVSLSLNTGEILGVAGLQGMGQNELFHCLFGLEPLDAGTIEVRGARVDLASPRDAIEAGVGISLVPEDRKTEALALNLSGLENISIPVINRFARFGWLNRSRERQSVERILERMQVHPRAAYQPCSSFSGGNQQKIAIAKWLLTGSRILLLFDPTRGIDVGTKQEIYALMREYADAGGAILFYSTDVLEIVNLSDRVAVMYSGQIHCQLVGEEINEESIMLAALGGPLAGVSNLETSPA